MFLRELIELCEKASKFCDPNTTEVVCSDDGKYITYHPQNTEVTKVYNHETLRAFEENNVVEIKFVILP